MARRVMELTRRYSSIGIGIGMVLAVAMVVPSTIVGSSASFASSSGPYSQSGLGSASSPGQGSSQQGGSFGASGSGSSGYGQSYSGSNGYGSLGYGSQGSSGLYSSSGLSGSGYPSSPSPGTSSSASAGYPTSGSSGLNSGGSASQGSSGTGGGSAPGSSGTCAPGTPLSAVPVPASSTTSALAPALSKLCGALEKAYLGSCAKTGAISAYLTQLCTVLQSAVGSTVPSSPPGLAPPQPSLPFGSAESSSGLPRLEIQVPAVEPLGVPAGLARALAGVVRASGVAGVDILVPRGTSTGSSPASFGAWVASLVKSMPEVTLWEVLLPPSNGTLSTVEAHLVLAGISGAASALRPGQAVGIGGQAWPSSGDAQSISLLGKLGSSVLGKDLRFFQAGIAGCTSAQDQGIPQAVTLLLSALHSAGASLNTGVLADPWSGQGIGCGNGTGGGDGQGGQLEGFSRAIQASAGPLLGIWPMDVAASSGG